MIWWIRSSAHDGAVTGLGEDLAQAVWGVGGLTAVALELDHELPDRLVAIDQLVVVGAVGHSECYQIFDGDRGHPFWTSHPDCRLGTHVCELLIHVVGRFHVTPPR